MTFAVTEPVTVVGYNVCPIKKPLNCIKIDVILDLRFFSNEHVQNMSNFDFFLAFFCSYTVGFML